MNHRINFMDGFIQDDMIWFSNCNHNALMTLDLKNGKVHSVGMFPECEYYQQNLHIRVIEISKCLYFIPQCGNLVHVFNLEKMAFDKSISLPYASNTSIANAILDEAGQIWIIPARLDDGIVIFDSCKQSAVIFKKIDCSNMASDAYIGHNCVCYNNGIISLCICKTNILVYIDTRKQVIHSEQISNKYHPYSFVSEDGERFFFSNDPDNEIVLWNKSENTYTPLSGVKFSSICLYENYIIKDNQIMCIPCDAKDLLIIDLSNKSKRSIPIHTMVNTNSVYPKFTFYRKYNGKIYLFPSGADGIIIIDGQDWSVRTLKYRIDTELQKQIQKACKQNFMNEMNSGLVREDIDYSDTLDEFLNYVTQNNKSEDATEQADCGSLIYSEMKGHVLEHQQKDK